MSLALASTPAIVSASADDRARSRPTGEQARPDNATAHERATRALERAQVLFGTPTGQRAQGASGSHGDATIVLRDLFSVLDDLSSAQRREARAILARPTDGPRFDQDAYTVKSVKQCGGKFCIHWVKRTKDAPPSKAWALKMLTLMNKVWKKEVGGLGYRRPLSDNGRGGNNKFDVYLAQLGNQGVYGYCAPERTKPGFQYLANGYCVLDTDFREFGTAPMKAAKATAAHEFFHAIQFGYDYLEDLWMMESTATWMEERVFDDVNDNRQYLPVGQLVEPLIPLDFYNVESNSIYANWVFFEFLSTSFGKSVVRNIWNKAGAFAGAPDLYSTQAIRNVLQSRGGFTKAYSRFVGANIRPATFYPEGGSWPSVKLASTMTLTSASPETGERGNPELLHMSSQTWRINSSASLTGPQFRLNVQVDGPAKFRMPGAHVLVAEQDGSVKRLLVKLDDNGNGTIQVPFDYATVASVYVSLVNASTRFSCGRRYVFSCNGLPIDDGQTFHGQPYKFSASVIDVG